MRYFISWLLADDLVYKDILVCDVIICCLITDVPSFIFSGIRCVSYAQMFCRRMSLFLVYIYSVYFFDLRCCAIRYLQLMTDVCMFFRLQVL